jgi:ligand-binding sensor domain-containing protein
MVATKALRHQVGCGKNALKDCFAIRWRMLRHVFVLMTLIHFISCNAHHKTIATQEPAEESNFILTDTVSSHGPRSITRNILQDRNGKIWFATWQGIIRYDPKAPTDKAFTNITLQEGLKHFHIFSLLENKNGQLWFGTVRGGVYRYDPEAASDKSFTYFTTKDGLADNSVMCMLEDKAGNTWMGTANGVSRFNSSTGTFTSFTTSDGLIHNAVYSMVQDTTGKIWFGTQGGVSCYDPFAAQPSFTHFPNENGLPFIGVRSVIEDKKGNIWIGSQSGLDRYNGKSFTTITTNSTACIIEDKTGNLWLSESGMEKDKMTLSRYDPEGEKSFTKMTSEPQVFGLAEDAAGNIWFGTVNGACCYDPGDASGKFFQFFRD